MDSSPVPNGVPDYDLTALGFTDPDRARRILLSLAGQGVTDDDAAALLPSLFDALRKRPAECEAAATSAAEPGQGAHVDEGAGVNLPGGCVRSEVPRVRLGSA